MNYLIITASLENKHGIKNDEHRKKSYINSITKALNLIKDKPIKAIIVENNGQRSTYLDDLGCDVVYTNNNSLNTVNKAVNELLDIKHVIQLYNIQDDDIVIKLTGRYNLMNDNFLYIALNTKGACIKFFNVCSQEFTPTDCVLGLYSIKCKFLKQFQYECKLSPEVEFASFVRNTVDEIKEVRYLCLMYCLAMNFKTFLV